MKSISPYKTISIFAAIAVCIFIGTCGCHTNCEKQREASDQVHVIHHVKIGANWKCKTEFAEDCVADYRKFIRLAKKHARPVDKDLLDKKIQALLSGSEHSPAPALTDGKLRPLLLDRLNISFLLDGIDQRVLTATTIRTENFIGYTEKEILFKDPFVGQFKGLFLLPDKSKPVPGIIALPGHVMNAKGFIDTYNGRKFAQGGFAFLAITMRGMGTGESEKRITRELLQNGFTFAGIQVYETLLALKYLESTGRVDTNRIGLYGHSGGCQIVQLAALIEHGFDSAVCDNKGGFISEGHNLVPGLALYREQIERAAEKKQPFLFVPYGHDHPFEKVIAFFKNSS